MKILSHTLRGLKDEVRFHPSAHSHTPKGGGPTENLAEINKKECPPRPLTFNVSLVSLMACRSASENLVGGAPDSEDGAGEGGTGSSPSGGAPATAAAGSAILSEGGSGGGSSLSSGLAFFEGDDDWSFREDVYTRRGGLALLITTGQGSWGPRSIGSRSLPAGTLLSAYQRSRRFNSKCVDS